LEKTQLVNLRAALFGFPFASEHYDEEYLPDLDKWSTGLLRRYIEALGQVGPLEAASLDDASLGDLRVIVNATLGVLASNYKRDFLKLAPAMCTFAPEEFDDDLYEPFAWLYGALIVDGFRVYVSLADYDLEADWRPHLSYSSIPR
jgi:hypothetical protein